MSKVGQYEWVPQNFIQQLWYNRTVPLLGMDKGIKVLEKYLPTTRFPFNKADTKSQGEPNAN